MALVDYTDSDASDAETSQPSKPSTNSTKPTFQKVVDRSNPGKIKVSLPQAAPKEETKDDEPPAKRAKTGGAFGGFNSLLPAPKRSGPVTIAGGLGGGSTARKGGLSAGVSLKTAAAPGFSRDAEPARCHTINKGIYSEQFQPAAGDLSLPPLKHHEPVRKTEDEVKLVGKPTMFRPLSVTRKPTKKASKQQIGASSTSEIKGREAPSTTADDTQPKPRPKVNLFSMGSEASSTVPVSSGEYQPIIYEAPMPSDAESTRTVPIENSFSDQSTGKQNAQSLDDIASDLNLSAAERRQLFGRQKHSQSGSTTAHRVINFNTDQEYQHNEELRAAGEQVVHNPVRAIAPGKHNLKQLINAAASQKDALEESFAKGKSNRAEASSRYGW